MELDEARLAGKVIEPILLSRLDRIEREMLNKFRSGKLSQEALEALRADWVATNRLLTEIRTLGGI